MFVDGYNLVSRGDERALKTFFDEIGNQQASRLVSVQFYELFRLALERANPDVIKTIVSFMAPQDVKMEMNDILYENETRETQNTKMFFAFDIACSRLKDKHLGMLFRHAIKYQSLLPFLRIFIRHVSNPQQVQDRWSFVSQAIESENFPALHMLLQANLLDLPQRRFETLVTAIDSGNVNVVEAVLEAYTTNTRTSLHSQVLHALEAVIEKERPYTMETYGMRFVGIFEMVKRKISQDMMRHLLNHIVSVDQDASDELQLKLLFWLSVYCNVEYVARIDWLRHRLAQLDEFWATVLFLACIENKCRGLAFLVLETNPRVDIHYDEDYALGIALQKEEFEIADYIVQQNTSAQAIDQALLKVSRSDAPNQAPMLEFLLRRGADVHVNDDECLINVCGKKYDSQELFPRQIEVVVLLVEKYGANIHASNGECLRRASRAGDAAVVNYLLERGVDVNAIRVQAGQRISPFSLALHHCHASVARLLLQNGVDPQYFLEHKNTLVDEYVNMSDSNRPKMERQAGIMLQMLLDTRHDNTFLLTADELADFVIQDQYLGKSEKLLTLLMTKYRSTDHRVAAFLIPCVDIQWEFGVRFLLDKMRTSLNHPIPAQLVFNAFDAYIEFVQRFRPVPHILQRNQFGAAIVAQGQRARPNVEILRMLVDAGADIHADNDALLRFAARNNYKEIVAFLFEYCYTPQTIDPIARLEPIVVETYASLFPAYHAGRWQKTRVTIQENNIGKVFFVGSRLFLKTSRVIGYISPSLRPHIQPFGEYARRPALQSNVFGESTNFEDAVGVGDNFVALLLTTILRDEQGDESMVRMVGLIKVDKDNHAFLLDSFRVLVQYPASEYLHAKLACVGQWLAIAESTSPFTIPTNPFAVINTAAINDRVQDAILWIPENQASTEWNRTARLIPLPDDATTIDDKFAFFALENYPHARRQLVASENSVPYRIQFSRNATTDVVQVDVSVFPNAPRLTAIPSGAGQFGTFFFLPHRHDGYDTVQGMLYEYGDDTMAEAIRLRRLSLISERLQERATSVMARLGLNEQRVAIRVAADNSAVRKDTEGQYRVDPITQQAVEIGRTLLRTFFPQPLANWSRGALRVYHGWQYSVKRAPWSASLQDVVIRRRHFDVIPPFVAPLPTPTQPLPDHFLPALRDELEDDKNRHQMAHENEENERMRE